MPNGLPAAFPWFDFLKTEVDIATTFIKVARTANHEQAARAVDGARRAIGEVRRCLVSPMMLSLSAAEVLLLERRCSEIESILEKHAT